MGARFRTEVAGRTAGRERYPFSGWIYQQARRSDGRASSGAGGEALAARAGDQIYFVPQFPRAALPIQPKGHHGRKPGDLSPSGRLIRPISARSIVLARRVTQDHARPFCTV